MNLILRIKSYLTYITLTKEYMAYQDNVSSSVYIFMYHTPSIKDTQAVRISCLY